MERGVITKVMDNPLIEAGNVRVDLSAPTTLADTGLSEDLITQLVIKLLHFNANYTGVEIAHRLGLEFTVVESILETLKQSQQCEVVGGGLLGAPSFRYRITDQGRRRAQLFLEHNQYVGAAPVPLAQYREYMTKYPAGDEEKRHPGHRPSSCLTSGVERSGGQPARCCSDIGAIAVYLRRSGKRQNGDRPGTAQSA